MEGSAGTGKGSVLSPIRRRDDGAVVMLDQRALPQVAREVVLESCEAVATAIADMVIRGAPAIGVAAAMGLALGARRALANGLTASSFEAMCAVMAASRPTAVNLFWAIARMRQCFELHMQAGATAASIVAALDAEAEAIFAEDLAQNRAIGAFGAELIPDGARILTHCNTGSLATAGWGTALGVIRSAVAAGKRIHVFADETRPWLQGARLTAWELMQDGIDVTLIADGAAGHLMRRGEIDLAIVGADRIAMNGDTANKIGTYTVACLCARHGLPFYVAAPRTTIDPALADGSGIHIEERPAHEVRTVFGHPVAPENVAVRNPSFDVTPADLISAVITERGIARPPYGPAITALFENPPRIGPASA
jgi:methylthioribose-1-phosphate isomerase